MADKKKKKKKKKPYRGFWIFVKIQTVFLLLVILAIGYYFWGDYAKKVSDMRTEAAVLVRNSTEETFRGGQTSTVYAVDGQVISTIRGEKDSYYLESEDIPKYVKQAFVSIEDKKFYKHNGIDVKAILRAAKSIIKNSRITQGGSTITQQLSRNIFLSHQVTWERKVEEMFIAMEIEKMYSKDKILEFYINNIYFSNGYYGIQAASKGYFNTDVDQLSLSQIAFLCAIPNNPTLYDPIDHMENTLKRRDRILDQMQKDGVLTEEEAEAAKSEEITLNLPEAEKSNYVETYVYHCAIRSLMEADGFKFRYEFASDAEKKAYEEEYDLAYEEGRRKLYNEGYQIYTSIDLSLQEQLQKSVDEQLASFDSVSEEGVYELQGAATCINNTTGKVAAIVGGRSQELTGYTYNRAYQSYRQPGSAIKPLIVYTPALEKGYTPYSTVVDEAIEDGPSNSNGKYMGEVTLTKAVANSINTVAWKLFEELTPKTGLSYLLNMNFAKIDKNDYALSSALGGFTNGVSSVEMASAYAALENDGVYRKPTCILKMVNLDGENVVDNDTKGTQVYKENAARMMTYMLQEVINSGTGKGLGLSDMPAAGKTGTTNDNKDGWFVGYTPYYTTSVWVGYDMPKKLKGLAGSSYPGNIWKQFMETIHEGLDRQEFVDYVRQSNKKDEEEQETKEDTNDEQKTVESSNTTTTQTEGSQQDNTDSSSSQTNQTPQGQPTPGQPADTPSSPKPPSDTPGQPQQTPDNNSPGGSQDSGDTNGNQGQTGSDDNTDTSQGSDSDHTNQGQNSSSDEENSNTGNEDTTGGSTGQ